MGRDWLLVGFWLAVSLCAVAHGQAPLTPVADTVYRADGTAAAGSVVVSWPSFTTGDGTAVPAGTMTSTLGSGGALSVSLVPNAGATPMGSYYTAVFHLSDGTVSREFWVVPVSVPGGGAAKLAGIRNQVLPTSVALQTVSKAYVDATVAKAVTGTLPATAPWVVKTGDAMAGPLTLPADPVNANHAADKHYVDTSVAAAVSSATSGPIAASRLPVFGASGSGHAVGAVPDPGATAGTARYLREDGSWSAPAGGGGGGAPTGTAGGDLSGTYPSPTVSAVHATAGSLDGVAIGQTTPAPGTLKGLTVSPNTGAPDNIALTIEVKADLLNGATNATYLDGGGRVYLGSSTNAMYSLNLTNTVAGIEGLKTLAVGSSQQFQVDSGGNALASSYTGPATAPAGSCSASGVWVLSKDGHATFCDAGTWVVKI